MTGYRQIRRGEPSVVDMALSWLQLTKLRLKDRSNQFRKILENKKKNDLTYKDVARKNCRVGSRLNGMAVRPTRSNEMEHHKKWYLKPAGREADCETKSRRNGQASQPKPPPRASSNWHSTACRVPKQIRTPKGKSRLHIAFADPFPRTQCWTVAPQKDRTQVLVAHQSKYHLVARQSKKTDS